jgi:hypothetical protein
MRYVKLLSMVLGLALVTGTALGDIGSNVNNRFGKGPTTSGLTQGYGGSSGGGYYYRPNVQPAPVIATAPTTTGRRAFSAEPTAPVAAPTTAAAPTTTAAPVKVACGCGPCCRCCL